MESLPSYELWLWGKWGSPRGLALGCVQLRNGQEPGWLGSSRVRAPVVPSGEPSDRTRAVGGGRLVKAMQSGRQPRSRVSCVHCGARTTTGPWLWSWGARALPGYWVGCPWVDGAPGGDVMSRHVGEHGSSPPW